MLDGQYGEFGPTTRGQNHYLELATQLHWNQLFSEIRAVPEEGARSSPTSGLRLLASDCRAYLSQLRRSPKAPIILLTREFSLESDAKPKRFELRPSQRRYQAEMLRMIMDKHATRLSAATVTQVRVSYPMADRRVIEFCLAAPGRMKVRGGYPRYLIRRALEGVLPKKIQWRKTKMPFSPDYYLRYNRQLPIAREFVNSIRAGDPVRTIVDVDQLSKLMVEVNAAKSSWEALIRIPATIYLIGFLRQFPEFQ